MSDRPAAPASPPRKLGVAEYAAGVRACDRTLLGRAITLVENSAEYIPQNPLPSAVASGCFINMPTAKTPACSLLIVRFPGLGGSDLT